MKISKIADVDDLHTRMLGMYTDSRKSWVYDENLYYMNHYAELDKATPSEEQIMVNKPTNVVDIAHAILSLHSPKITAQPVTPARRSDRTADRVEKFIAGCLYVNNLRYEGNQIAKALFDQVLYGRGAMFSGWDPDLEGDDKEYSELPLTVRYVNHKNLMCLPGGKKKDLAQMYACYRRAEDLEGEWGKTIKIATESGKRKAEPTEELLYKDLWYWNGSIVYHCAAAGATWLRSPVDMPYYDRLPYTEFVGRSTTSEELHLRKLGVLFPLREAVSILERWLNQGSAVVAAFADPPILHDEKIQLSTAPGSTIPVRVPEGRSIKDYVHSLAPSDAAPGVYRFISIAANMVEEGSFSRWAYANVEPESGPVVQGMNANDRMRLMPFMRNAELAISSVIQKMLQCAHAFAKADPGERKLQVFSEGERSAIALKADDLRGWLVTAKLSDELPADTARNWAIASNAVQSRLPISSYTIQQRLLGIEQPEDEERRRMVEQFMANPDIINAALQIALAEGNEELKERIMPGAAQTQPGTPPTPTGPYTSATHPQMAQPMPPGPLQATPPPGAPRALEGVAPGAPRGPQP